MNLFVTQPHSDVTTGIGSVIVYLSDTENDELKTSWFILNHFHPLSPICRYLLRVNLTGTVDLNNIFYSATQKRSIRLQYRSF